MQGANLVPRQGRAPPPPRKQGGAAGGGEERVSSPPRAAPGPPSSGRAVGANGGAQFQPPKPGNGSGRPRSNTPPGNALSNAPSAPAAPAARKPPGPPAPPTSSASPPRPNLSRVASQPPEVGSVPSRSPRPGAPSPGPKPPGPPATSSSKSAASAPPSRAPLGDHDDSPAQFRLPVPSAGPGGVRGGAGPPAAAKSPSAKFAPPKPGGAGAAKPPPKPAALHVSPAASPAASSHDDDDGGTQDDDVPKRPVLAPNAMPRRGSTGLHLNRRESEMLAELGSSMDAPPSPSPKPPSKAASKAPPPRPAGAGSPAGPKPPSSPSTGLSSGSFKKPPPRPSPRADESAEHGNAEESAPAVSPSASPAMAGSSRFPPPRPGGSARPTTATNSTQPPPRTSSPGHTRNGGPSGSAPFTAGRVPPTHPPGVSLHIEGRSPGPPPPRALENDNAVDGQEDDGETKDTGEDAQAAGRGPQLPGMNRPPPRVTVGPPTPARPSATSTSSAGRPRGGGSVSGSPHGAGSPAASPSAGSPANGSPAGTTRLLQMPNVHTLASAQDGAEAFAETENVYVHQGLKVLCHDFINGLKNNSNPDLKKILASPELIQSQFELNASAIFDFNTKLDAELANLRQQSTLLEQLGKTMTRYIPFFKMYAAYIMNYRPVSKFFRDLMKNNKKFSAFMGVVEKSSGSNLESLISAPTSRLPQYLVFLGAIHSKCPEDAPHTEELAKATTAIKTVTDDISVSMRDKSGRDLVVMAQQKWFKNSIDLISPHRLVVKHGPLKLVEQTGKFKTKLEKNLFVLCNDCILYGSKAGRLTGGTVRYVMRLKGGSVREIPDTPSVDYKNAFVIVFASADHSKQPIVACSQSTEERAKWMKAITQAIEEDKEKLGGAEVDDDAFATQVLKRSVKTMPKSPANTDSETKAASTAVGASSTGASGPPPGAAPKRCKWKKIQDPASGDFYFEHIETYESTWEQPLDYFEEKDVSRGPPPRSGAGGGAPPSAPEAPEAPSAPDAPAAPEAPGAPGAPDLDEQFAAGPRFTVAPPTSPRKKGGGLLDDIKSGAQLKSAGDRALPPAKPEPKKGANLQDALKSSLDQYRKFVQDEEEEDDEDDWT